MKVAAFDVGTNTVLMLAVQSHPNGELTRLLDLSRITRVGKGVDQNGKLDPQAAKRTLDTIVEFAGEARAAGAERIVAAATSALRDASDGAEFIREVKERAGVELRIITGREEAELSRLAVMRGLELEPDCRLLIVDVGGGSTELIRAEPGRELQMESLQIGSVRLTERIIRHDPPSADETGEIERIIDRYLDQLGWTYRPNTLVGIAGTVTTVCAVALEMETYDPEVVHGHLLLREEVSRVTRMFRECNLARRKQLKGLVEARADVIFAGAKILERIMCRFGAREVLVSDQGVRWGLAWREIERIGKAAPRG